MRLVLAAITSLVAITSFVSSVAQAQAQSPSTPAPSAVTHVQTAANLAAMCDPAGSGVPRLEAIAYCQGFITSAGQYHSLLHPAGGRSRPLYCVPTPGPSIAQPGLAFAAWVRANPARNGEPALDALLRWAGATFPCPPAAASSRAKQPAR